MIRSVYAQGVERERAFRTRVWLNGVEVTHDCQIAIVDEPDEAGAVLLLKRNARGYAYKEPNGDIARAWHFGHVVLAEKER